MKQVPVNGMQRNASARSLKPLSKCNTTLQLPCKFQRAQLDLVDKKNWKNKKRSVWQYTGNNKVCWQSQLFKLFNIKLYHLPVVQCVNCALTSDRYSWRIPRALESLQPVCCCFVCFFLIYTNISYSQSDRTKRGLWAKDRNALQNTACFLLIPACRELKQDIPSNRWLLPLYYSISFVSSRKLARTCRSI